MPTRKEIAAAREERDREIVSAFLAKPEEIKTLALRFHVSESTCYRALRNAEVDTSDEAYAHAMEIAKARRIMPAVAKEYGRYEVAQIAKHFNVPERVVRAAIVFAIQEKRLIGPFAEAV